jgi:hypothetical protein
MGNALMPHCQFRVQKSNQPKTFSNAKAQRAQRFTRVLQPKGPSYKMYLKKPKFGELSALA